jgi:catechol 2,3-dioxygenase-like lactoylglutathione lyase family enzyme
LDWRLEVVVLPVSDVDRAKEFYVEKLGFNLDVDHRAGDAFRVVQTTPPGSACSITFGQDYGSYLFFSDPDGNSWAVQEVPGR